MSDLPAGFTLDEPSSQAPPLPEGFTLDPVDPHANPKAQNPEEYDPTSPAYQAKYGAEKGVGGFVADMGRAGAMQAGAALKGAAGLVALPSDAVVALLNMAGITNWKPASQSVNEAIDSVTPEPQNVTERVTNRIAGAAGSAAGGIGLGRALLGAGAEAAGTALAPSVPAINSQAIDHTLSAAIGRALAQAPGAQGAGAVGGGVASQLAAEVGGGPVAQLVAGVAGGGLAGGAKPIATAAGRGAGAIVQPLSRGGRETIAGNALRMAATDAKKAATTLKSAPGEVVPGSAPTTAEVAADTGLANFQTRLRALGDARFGQRMSQQNEARQKLIDTIAGGGESKVLDRLTTRRDAVTTKLRDRAFSEAEGKSVNTQKVLEDIDGLLAVPENAGQSVQSALKSVRTQIEGKSDARSLYAVRKEINRVLEGKYVGADESVLRYAGGQLGQVKGSIDNAITEVAPSWKAYLVKYAQLSRPIERVQTVADIRGKTSLAAPDISTGREFLSQAKWKNAVEKSMPELSQTMTKGQLEKLRRISTDLDRGAAVGAANKLPGSDTAANLVVSGQISVANIISRALKTPAKKLPPGLATAMKPLSFVYSLPDEAVRELLVDAMLDPKLADRLLQQGTPENLQAFVNEFAQKAQAGTLGGAEAGASQQSGP